MRLEEKEFREVVESQQTLVFSIALRILRDHSAAEEVAQDVFLALYEQQLTIENPLHLTRWLQRVTTHRSIDWIRKKQRRRETLTDESVLDDLLPLPSSHESSSWLVRQVDSLVGSLQEIPRTILVLRYQQELTPEEIAEMLQMPLATVKSHLQRSLKLLRQKAERTAR